jgi:cytoskeletal protein RodZ
LKFTEYKRKIITIMKKQKFNQKGFAHLGLVLLLVMVVGVVGTGGYLVGVRQNAKKATEARQAADKAAEEEAKRLAELKAKEIEDQKAEEEKAAEVQVQEPAKPVATTTTTTKKKAEPTTTTTKPKPVYFSFSNVTPSFDNGVLTVSATWAQPYTGKCKLYLTKDGQSAVKKYHEVSGTSCSPSVSASDLPAAGDWNWTLYFFSNDGVTSASSSSATQTF